MVFAIAVNKMIGVRCDQIIKLAGIVVSKDYPTRLLQIKYCDSEAKYYRKIELYLMR